MSINGPPSIWPTVKRANTPRQQSILFPVILYPPLLLNISSEDIFGERMGVAEIEGIASDFSRFYILTILYEGPSHGYSILTKFKKRVGKEISPSLVYPFLQHLEQRGFVKHSIKQAGAKKRKVFQLTKEGEELCRRLFKRFSALVSAAIESSLIVCANCGCKVYEGGHKEVINGSEMSFCCIHCAESYKQEMLRRHSEG